MKNEMFKVAVIIQNGIAFTPDTQIERNNSIIMEFNGSDANDLIMGMGIDVSVRTVCLN